MTIQLEGAVLFGISDVTNDDVSAEVFHVTITEERESQTRRPTFANATRSVRAGAASAEATASFEEGLDPTTSLAHAAATAAIRRDDARMWISATLKTGAVSASNPAYEGYVVVTQVSTGGEVGEELEQEQTWSFDEDGFAIRTAP